ncbi:ExbD/TolR family protein [Cerasicoccus arenae]|uniref:Biopolymer transporter ExbD n=1 Tax=Cerasicoccus arenae TaxID=424488 RepID=A0A8J3GE21_9BACT|nr:biopolymer transporter ExbD [Cerasicoccus arenae]MBK1857193.1 biopolymer transporter ExbD [Cerasicoccus arenae]GHB99905.1 biopolymer transporter ExbD [Cerasicoccus arenae]
MKPRPIDETTDLPDLTPMIDIVFLLIVFFMTVANMQVMQQVEIDVPIAESSTIPEDRANRITVTLKDDGSIYYGPTLVVLDDLPAIISQNKSDVPSLKVYVRADARVPFKHVREVFAATAKGGVPDVVFATFQSDK